MEAVLFMQLFEKQRNSIGGKSERQATPLALLFFAQEYFLLTLG
jgi:hypothetical protein